MIVQCPVQRLLARQQFYSMKTTEPVGASSFSYYNGQSSAPGNRTSSFNTEMNIYEKFDGEFVPPQHKYIEHEKFGSAYFKDNNEEEYVIQRAFQPNNFTSLRDLPDNMQRNCILNERKERVKQQIESENIKRLQNPYEKEELKTKKISEIKKAKIGSLGYFEVFPYQESDYQLPHKLEHLERVENQKKRKEISDLDFRPVGFDMKLRHEDPFRYIDRLESTTGYCGGSEYVYPFHVPQDVYNAFQESERRQRIITEQLKVAGNFVPSKTLHSLNTVSKAKLPEVLNEIEYYFKKFLKGKIGYFIGVNKRDYIEIMFESKYQEDGKVQMVLSGMLEHEILSKFVLRRNLFRWGVINQKNGYLEYVVLPPWVKDPEQVLKVPTNVEEKGKDSRQTR